MTKRYSLVDGKLSKDSYPHVFWVSSHEEQCTSIEDFYVALGAHALNNNCVLKGSMDQALKEES